MKNLRNIIFLSENKIAVVVLNSVNNKSNILFANEIEVDKGDIQYKLSKLLTDAANFLGFNIKAVDLVFEDYVISNKLVKKVYVGCDSKEQVIRQIYNDARLENKFVNNVIFNELEIKNNIASVNAYALVSNYNVYDSFRQVVKHCNVEIENCVNLATLLNSNKEEIVISLQNNNSFACLYAENALTKCVDLHVNFDGIVEKIANKFACSKESILHQINIAKIVVKNDNYDYDLSWNYDFKNKVLTSVKANKFVKEWQEELLNQIKSNASIDNLNNAIILTNNGINNFTNSKVKTDIVGLDTLSDEIILSICNVNRLPVIENHSKYDSQIENEFERIIA